MSRLEAAIGEILPRSPQDSNRLRPLADYLIARFAENGLPGLTGGSQRELRIPGFARRKDWDVAYDFAGKPRLLISLKSIWKNASGVVPNRLDDLMGEAANAQQMSPELVIGYVMLFDVAADSPRREPPHSWSEFLEERLGTISIRKVPLWNQGLIEGNWFIRFDSRLGSARIIDLAATEEAGDRFVRSLLDELHLREPAIPLVRPGG